MPGMPIFQDSPSQLKGQIYVLDSVTKEIVPLQVDNEGKLSVNGTVDLPDDVSIDTVNTVTTVGSITNDVGVVNGATPLEVELAADTTIDTVNTVTTVGSITNDVGVVNGATPLEVELAANTTIDTVDTITNDVKVVNGTTPLKVENQLVFTNVDSFGGPGPLTEKTIGIGATVESEAQDVSQESSYNWFIKNNGTAETQDITVKVEISPDGTNWVEDTGTTIEVPHGTAKLITVTHFLQYVRFVITGGAAETTVISCFQAQH